MLLKATDVQCPQNISPSKSVTLQVDTANSNFAISARHPIAYFNSVPWVLDWVQRDVYIELHLKLCKTADAL